MKELKIILKTKGVVIHMIFLMIVFMIVSSFFMYKKLEVYNIKNIKESSQSSNKIVFTHGVEETKLNKIFAGIRKDANIREIVYDSTMIFIKNEIKTNISNLSETSILKFRDKMPLADVIEFNSKYKGDSIYLKGRYLNNHANEIVINKIAMDLLGLNTNNAINTKLSLTTNDSFNIVENYIIVGVISDDYYKISNSVQDQKIMPEIYLPYKILDALLKAKPELKGKSIKTVDIYFKNYLEKEKTKNIILEKLANSQMQLVDYQPDIELSRLEKTLTIASLVISIISALLLILMFSIVSLVLSSQILINKKLFDIFIKNGVNIYKLSKFIFILEIVLSGIALIGSTLVVLPITYIVRGNLKFLVPNNLIMSALGQVVLIGLGAIFIVGIFTSILTTFISWYNNR